MFRLWFIKSDFVPFARCTRGAKRGTLRSKMLPKHKKTQTLLTAIFKKKCTFAICQFPIFVHMCTCCFICFVPVYFVQLFCMFSSFLRNGQKMRCFSPLKPNTNYLQSRNPRDKREKIGRHEMFRGFFLCLFWHFLPPPRLLVLVLVFSCPKYVYVSCVFIYIFFPWFSSYECLFYFLHFFIQKTNASPDHWHVVPPLSFADKPRGKPLEVFII